ncbi:acid protease, partial [Clavulina sp. PMI_390]
SVGLSDYYSGTDLQWYGSFQAGTPAQSFQVVYDTGVCFDVHRLHNLGVQCTTCGTQNRFDPSASSTFYSYGANSTETFGTGGGVDPNDADAQTYTLFQSRDMVSIAGLPAVVGNFSLITNETAGFVNDPYDGIVGMAYGDGVGYGGPGIFQSLVASGLPALFSLALYHNGTNGSEITLGGIDDTKFKEPLTYIPLSGPELWVLNNTQISVNGKTSATLQNSASSSETIFDSGTSNVVLPPDVAAEIYALISPKIQPVGTAGAYGLPCSEIGNITATLDFTFTSASGKPFNLTIPPEELNVGPFKEDPSTCQTLINAQGGYYVLGGSLLKHYYSVWDQGNSRMGFS